MPRLSEERVDILRPAHSDWDDYDPKWHPMPGEEVVDHASPDETYGLVISDAPDRGKVLVLWSTFTTRAQRQRAQMVSDLADQIRDEEDNEIHRILIAAAVANE